MILLALGLVLFIGVHLIPTFTPLRQTLIGRLGHNKYRGAFSAVALLGLILLVIGKTKAGSVPVYEPPTWGRQLALALMVPAFILLPAAHMRTNVKRFTRHPMLWGVTLWSIAHLSANGDLASIVLFGALGAYSLFGMVSANLRGAAKSTTRYPVIREGMVLMAGIAGYAVFLALHPYLFGVSAAT